jgi:hypothetical protein
MWFLMDNGTGLFWILLVHWIWILHKAVSFGFASFGFWFGFLWIWITWYFAVGFGCF